MGGDGDGGGGGVAPVVTMAATAHSGSDGDKRLLGGAPQSCVAIVYMANGAPG